MVDTCKTIRCWAILAVLVISSTGSFSSPLWSEDEYARDQLVNDFLSQCRDVLFGELETDEELYLPPRPTRFGGKGQLGSEFLGKRALPMEPGCEDVPDHQSDEFWACQCLRLRSTYSQLSNRDLEDVSATSGINKRGLGAILLSGKRMNNKLALLSSSRKAMGSEFLGKRGLGSEFLGKRKMGNEFLGKRSGGLANAAGVMKI